MGHLPIFKHWASNCQWVDTSGSKVYFPLKNKNKFSHIVEFVHIVDETNSHVNIAKTQLTNHILKGLCGKLVQNCAYIPTLITLLHQGPLQPNTQMKQPKVFGKILKMASSKSSYLST
jgi:hypothetical protein